MKRLFSLLLALTVACGAAWAQKFALPQGGYDGRRILLVGNSFTYFHNCDSMLLQISRSQGLDLRLGEYLKGGQTFGQHLNLPKTSEAIAAGSYRFAFIQDMSTNAALYDRDHRKDVLANTVELKRRILQASPDCQVILERTWSYEGSDAGGFGTGAKLDEHLGRGAAAIARKADVWLSPIGLGFNTVRAERPDINLFEPDAKHQSAEGSYLKCCINYLVLTGKPFHGEVATCGVAPEIAAYLRKVAERTVLGHEKEYRIKR
jgi:hypothetical protein